MSTTATRNDTRLTEQDAVKLAAVYMQVARNWAVYVEEIVEAINSEDDPRFRGTNTVAVNSMLRQLEKLGLLASEHVNGEKPLTWQSYFDIENEDDAEENAEAAFIQTIAPLMVAGSKVPRSGATGPRYTEAQIAAGLRARARGESNKAVAEAAGVKSPNYFAKILKEAEAKGRGRQAAKQRAVRGNEKAAEAKPAKKSNKGPADLAARFNFSGRK